MTEIEQAHKISFKGATMKPLPPNSIITDNQGNTYTACPEGWYSLTGDGRVIWIDRYGRTVLLDSNPEIKITVTEAAIKTDEV